MNLSFVFIIQSKKIKQNTHRVDIYDMGVFMLRFLSRGGHEIVYLFVKDQYFHEISDKRH